MGSTLRSPTRRQNEALSRRHAKALARAGARLEREVARRKAREETIRKARKAYRSQQVASRIMEKKLRLLTRQIISAQEEERKEISRELHDEVVQTLVGITVALATLGKGADVGVHGFRAKIARTQRLVEKSVTAVHRFARELRPAVLDDLGLIPALHLYCKDLASRKGLNVRMTAFAGVEALTGVKRSVLFRVAQEALTNVVRHAQATQIQLNITDLGQKIRMEIIDNGRSFEVGRMLLGGNHRRLGLIGMKERVAMVGGELTIESQAGVGTTVRADVPFRRDGGRK